MSKLPLNDEILTDKEKLCYIHGFIIGLMTGHNDTRVTKPDYFDIETELISRLEMSDITIEMKFIDKLKELDLYSIYKSLD
jgi:hypothetical protein